MSLKCKTPLRDMKVFDCSVEDLYFFIFCHFTFISVSDHFSFIPTHTNFCYTTSQSLMHLQYVDTAVVEASESCVVKDSGGIAS